MEVNAAVERGIVKAAEERANAPLSPLSRRERRQAMRFGKHAGVPRLALRVTPFDSHLLNARPGPKPAVKIGVSHG